MISLRTTTHYSRTVGSVAEETILLPTIFLSVKQLCEIISTVFDFKGDLIIPLKAQSEELSNIAVFILAPSLEIWSSILGKARVFLSPKCKD